ncbi:hypothetical protein Acr_20g0004660 [Actinidia rufa]|uniref:Uncharacterized protein n=1 Tax=Actinidia rufa TaxID=165716 RepID=A0A7J0GD92_9ERIC|nr:hypothetical protein Acr_20g0004660 [Actinidia rufa]
MREDPKGIRNLGFAANKVANKAANKIQKGLGGNKQARQQQQQATTSGHAVMVAAKRTATAAWRFWQQ